MLERIDDFRLDEIVPRQSTAKFTLADVSEHCSYDDCWLVICDRVYNVTSFLREHPGGEEIILENAGRDATVAFLSAGHSRSALQVLHRYKIGLLVEQERLNFWCDDVKSSEIDTY